MALAVRRAVRTRQPDGGRSRQAAGRLGQTGKRTRLSCACASQRACPACVCAWRRLKRDAFGVEQPIIRAGQTIPALFFFLRLDPQTVVGGHCWNEAACGGAVRRLRHRAANQKKERKNMAAHHNPKTVVVVPVVRVVVVTRSGAGIVLIIVPRTPAQHPAAGFRAT